MGCSGGVVHTVPVAACSYRGCNEEKHENLHGHVERAGRHRGRYRCFGRDTKQRVLDAAISSLAQRRGGRRVGRRGCARRWEREKHVGKLAEHARCEPDEELRGKVMRRGWLEQRHVGEVVG